MAGLNLFYLTLISFQIQDNSNIFASFVFVITFTKNKSYKKKVYKKIQKNPFPIYANTLTWWRGLNVNINVAELRLGFKFSVDNYCVL